jgi:hypothetical protein
LTCWVWGRWWKSWKQHTAEDKRTQLGSVLCFMLWGNKKILLSQIHTMSIVVVINDMLWFHLLCACPFFRASAVPAVWTNDVFYSCLSQELRVSTACLCWKVTSHSSRFSKK